MQVLFDAFLFGSTKPFGTVVAYLGRVEQQARKSPHLHLLLWLNKTAPVLSGNSRVDSQAISDFIELFCTATLFPDVPTYDQISLPSQQFPITPLSHGI